MSIGLNQPPSIAVKFIFGMNSSINNCLSFIDQDKIAYPAAYHIVEYNTKTKHQEYFNGPEGYRCFTTIALSQQRRFLAASVKGEKPAIVIYDTFNHKKKKTLIYPDNSVRDFISLQFVAGHENQKLISLSNGNQGCESILVYWHITNIKVLASIKLGQVEVSQILTSLHDPNYISVLGDQFFKCFRYSEITEENGQKQQLLKQTQSHTFNEQNKFIYTCHTWLQLQNQCIVGTQNGELILLNYEGKQISILKNSPNHHLKQDFLIKTAISYQQGFIIGGENQRVFIYSMHNDKIQLDQSLQIKTSNEIKEIYVSAIALTPETEEYLAVSLSNNQIFQTKMPQKNQEKMIEYEHNFEHNFEQIGLQFHHKQINDIDLAVKKPLIASCGADKYIRIWNYDDKTLECSKVFTEEAYCISIHPSGLFLVVGFQDKLKMMSIILHNNQIKYFKEIPFKACKEVQFSNGGQYFAAVNGSNNNQNILIFDTYTGENKHILKGHNGRVRHLLWSRDDRILASCGADGMIYAWQIGNDFARIFEAQKKNANFSCIAMTNDFKYIHGVSNDRYLQIRQVPDGSEEKKEMQAIISQICFTQSNKVLFAAISDESRLNGAVRCYKCPGFQSFSEYIAHDDLGVEKMRVTFDDKYLITAGKDGSIILFDIKDKEVRTGSKMIEGFPSHLADEILITRGDLEDLQTQKDNLKNQHQDNLQAQTNSLIIGTKDDVIKELEEQLVSNKIQFQKQYEEIQDSIEKFIIQEEDEIQKLQQKLEITLQEQDSTFQKSIMQEVAKYEESKRNQEIINAGYEKKIAQLQEDNKNQLEKLENEQKRRLDEEKNERLVLENEKDKLQNDYNEIIKQIEFETTEEKQNLQKKLQKDQSQISDKNLKAKSDVAIINKKIASQKQEQAEIEEQKKNYEITLMNLQEQNEKLRKDIENQNLKIEESDKTIGEKEKKIYELKKRSQELEKFKFVLDHKIKELKREIGPREEEIQKMKDETNDMDQKLKKFNTINNTLGAVVEDLDQKQTIMNKTIKSHREHIGSQNFRIKHFKDSVYQAVQFIQNNEMLIKHSKELYQNFVTKDLKMVEIESDIKAEYISQKKYLEKSVKMLKKNLIKDNEIHKQDEIRIMRENIDLIRNINQLRKKLKEIKFNQKSDENKIQKDDDQNYQDELQLQTLNEKNKILEIQNQQIEKLQEKFKQLQEEKEKFN